MFILAYLSYMFGLKFHKNFLFRMFLGHENILNKLILIIYSHGKVLKKFGQNGKILMKIDTFNRI